MLRDLRPVSVEPITRPPGMKLRRSGARRSRMLRRRRGEARSARDARLRWRERATAIAGGIVTRMRRDAVFIGGSVERLSQPRDRARPSEIRDRGRTRPDSLASQRTRLGHGNAASSRFLSEPTSLPADPQMGLIPFTDHEQPAAHVDCRSPHFERRHTAGHLS
jgi:hypothetical protein